MAKNKAVKPREWDVAKLTFSDLRVTDAGAIDIHGINAADFVACCDEGLLKEIVREAGFDFCADVHKWVE